MSATTTNNNNKMAPLIETVKNWFPSLDLYQPHHHRITNEVGRQLTADQVTKHPEYPHVNWNLPSNKRERIEVARGRGGPFKLAYEIHGKGPRKIVVRLPSAGCSLNLGLTLLSQWIMGLGGYMKTWQRQTKDFGHTEADKYTCLIFDNRGMGDSDKPLLRYTTSEMARDIVELLDHVGWTDPRSVHVVGISMGGEYSISSFYRYVAVPLTQAHAAWTQA